MLKGLKRLHNSGQRLWLNNVTRESIQNGSLRRYIRDWSITGVTISPFVVYESLNISQAYNNELIKNLSEGVYGEALACELILEDVRFAADQLRHVYERTSGVDGWVALPVWPIPANDVKALPAVVSGMYGQVRRPNALITVTSCKDMMWAIEEIAYAGVPLNIGSVYTPDHFQKVSDAYLKGVERRITAGLAPSVFFISVVVSRLIAACLDVMPENQAISATISVAREIYTTLRKIHISQRWERTYTDGARPLRIVWDGYPGMFNQDSEKIISHLVSPFTVASLPEDGMERYLNIERDLFQVSTNDSDLIDKTDTHLNENIEKLLENEVALQVKEWINLLDAVARKSAEIM